MTTIPTLAERLEVATVKAEDASGIMHDVANGDAVTEVPTASGPVPSIAKWYADLNDRTSGAVGQVAADLEAEVQARQQHEGAQNPHAQYRLRGSVKNVSANTAVQANDEGILIVDAGQAAVTITLPASDSALGIRDYIVRRSDNSGNRLKVQAAGADKIKFHTHLNAAGYGFLVLMGAGDWWHLRSDGAGSWWPVGRADTTPLGRPVFDTTTAFPPGGYGALSGASLTRADWPWLWDHAQQSGMLTTEAARVGMEGGWTSGDGALTFRGPEGRAEFLRILDESRGVDPGRIAGSRQADDLKSHVHSNGFISQVQAGSGGSYWAGASISNTGAAGGTETRPKNIAYPGRIKLI